MLNMSVVKTGFFFFLTSTSKGKRLGPSTGLRACDIYSVATGNDLSLLLAAADPEIVHHLPAPLTISEWDDMFPLRCY